MRLLLTVAAVVLALQSAVSPVAAQVPAPTCAASPVKATGGIAALEGAARSKARTAWIKKVTHSKRLGPAWAAWLRAKEASYACRKQGRQHVCDATAIPCKL